MYLGVVIQIFAILQRLIFEIFVFLASLYSVNAVNEKNEKCLFSYTHELDIIFW